MLYIIVIKHRNVYQFSQIIKLYTLKGTSNRDKGDKSDRREVNEFKRDNSVCLRQIFKITTNENEDKDLLNGSFILQTKPVTLSF